MYLSAGSLYLFCDLHQIPNYSRYQMPSRLPRKAAEGRASTKTWGASGMNFRFGSEAEVQQTRAGCLLLANSGRWPGRGAMSAHSHKRKLARPKEVEHWSLTTIREKLVKIGAKVVSHGRYVTFQLAEVAVPRHLFRKILRLIDGLRPRPAPT